VNAFFDRVDSDDSFAQQLETVRTDPAAVQAVLVDAGFDLDPEAVRDGFLDRFGSQLTEEQLAAVAGGLTQDQNMAVVAGVSIGGAGIAIGVAAASAAAA